MLRATNDVMPFHLDRPDATGLTNREAPKVVRKALPGMQREGSPPHRQRSYQTIQLFCTSQQLLTLAPLPFSKVHSIGFSFSQSSNEMKSLLMYCHHPNNIKLFASRIRQVVMSTSTDACACQQDLGLARLPFSSDSPRSGRILSPGIE